MSNTVPIEKTVNIEREQTVETVVGVYWQAYPMTYPQPSIGEAEIRKLPQPGLDVLYAIMCDFARVLMHRS